MSNRAKKIPGDYPLYSFRVTSEEKDELNGLVDEVRDALNKRLDSNERIWMKNEVLFKALKLGLPMLRKTASKNQGKI